MNGKETVLYNFCSALNCSDGLLPYAGLIQDAEGNLYGTASAAESLIRIARVRLAVARCSKSRSGGELITMTKTTKTSRETMLEVGPGLPPKLIPSGKRFGRRKGKEDGPNL